MSFPPHEAIHFFCFDVSLFRDIGIACVTGEIKNKMLTVHIVALGTQQNNLCGWNIYVSSVGLNASLLCQARHDNNILILAT